MLLAIDVGNTNTVLGLYRLASNPENKSGATELVADWRVTTSRNLTMLPSCIVTDTLAPASVDAVISRWSGTKWTGASS